MKIYYTRGIIMEKQLTIYETPIKGVQYFALSIIFGDKRILPWFFSNYIQLEWIYNKDIVDRYIKFSYFEEYYIGIPFINKQIFIREVISDTDVVRFLIRNIDAGWYTQLCLDEYYIPGKTSFQDNHYGHDNLICGYNLTKEIFTLFGYNNDRKLGFSYASFEQIRNAYASTDIELFPVIPNSFSYGNLIFLIKPDEEVSYSLDLNCIEKLLKEYLNGSNFAIRNDLIYNPTDEKLYGMNIYDELISRFRNYVESVVEDIRLLHTIYEHKKVMVMRIKYLKELSYIPPETSMDEFDLLEKKAQIARNLQLKYVFLLNTDLLDKIADILVDMKHIEAEAIKKLIIIVENVKLWNKYIK